ncbi:MAG: hypothetical protein OHK0046_28010 [Anaerolineae bacterium]
MEVGVSIKINARPERVWALLTNAGDFPRWNTTVKSIDGVIAPGQTINLKTTAVPDRTFRLRITIAEPHSLMIWQDGRAPMFSGMRRYTLTPNGSATTFSMTETFAGLMLPMIAGSLPDFRPTFERYAADLKAEAERA